MNATCRELASKAALGHSALLIPVIGHRLPAIKQTVSTVTMFGPQYKCLPLAAESTGSQMGAKYSLLPRARSYKEGCKPAGFGKPGAALAALAVLTNMPDRLRQADYAVARLHA